DRLRQPAHAEARVGGAGARRGAVVVVVAVRPACPEGRFAGDRPALVGVPAVRRRRITGRDAHASEPAPLLALPLGAPLVGLGGIAAPLAGPTRVARRDLGHAQ